MRWGFKSLGFIVITVLITAAISYAEDADESGVVIPDIVIDVWRQASEAGNALEVMENPILSFNDPRLKNPDDLLKEKGWYKEIEDEHTFEYTKYGTFPDVVHYYFSPAGRNKGICLQHYWVSNSGYRELWSLNTERPWWGDQLLMRPGGQLLKNDKVVNEAEAKFGPGPDKYLKPKTEEYRR